MEVFIWNVVEEISLDGTKLVQLSCVPKLLLQLWANFYHKILKFTPPFAI